jgi:hypothetical protein
MIPFQTILALLAVLIAVSGCAQRLPPIPGGRTAVQNSANATGSPTPSAQSGSQQQSNGSNSNGAYSSSLTVSGSAKTTEIDLKGQEAANLSQMLAIQAKAGVKQGEQIECTHQDNAKDPLSADECVINVSMPDGNIGDLIPLAQVQKGTAEKPEKAPYDADGKGYAIQVLDADQDKSHPEVNVIRLRILNDNAKEVYNSLSGTPISKPVSLTNNDQVLRKGTGSNISCDWYALEKDSPYESAGGYVCYLYIHSDSGLIEKID